MTRPIARILALAASLAVGCRRAPSPPRAPSSAPSGTAPAPTDAAPADASAPDAPSFAREVRGVLRLPTADATRCETADGAVVLFDRPAVFTVSAADRVVGMRAWARGHGRLFVVIETEGTDDAAPTCVESETEGSPAALEFPRDAWTVARVYVASRTGATSPFAAGLTDAAEVPATGPQRIPAPAPDEVRVRWVFTEQAPCGEDDCAALALQLSRAHEQTLTARTGLQQLRCRASADYAHPAAIGFGCSAAGFDTVSLQAARQPGRYEVILEHESHGACGGRCPRSREVLHRFGVAPGLRLVAHPAGVFSW